jgi:sulfoxide reductase heme-binding subunit YedZ
VLLVTLAGVPGDTRTRISIGLAYAAMLALAVTLSLGTINLIRGRPNAVSSDLRRDLGLWAAFLAVGHTAVGLTVHFRGRMALYFLSPPEQVLPGPVRLDFFGLANQLGLLATLIFAGLALISRDASLARLGIIRWKWWQRWVYVATAATVVHGVLYQFLESRSAVLVTTFAGLGAWIIAIQWTGVRRSRPPDSTEHS